MLNADDLNAGKYLRLSECWINIYFNYEQGGSNASRELAEYMQLKAKSLYGWKVIYRLHVKRK